MAHVYYRHNLAAEVAGKENCKMRRLLFLFLFFMVAMGVGMAQNAAISGLITDSSKAVLPNATVIITHQDTGTKQTTVSNGEGYYVASPLPSGRYQVVVSAPGFESVTRDGITLQVGQLVRLDFELTPGATKQTIEVHAEVVALNSEQAEVATNLDVHVVKDLPLSLSSGLTGQAMRRQIDQFLFLVPGSTGTGFSHRLNGGVDMSNEVYYNGVPFTFVETQGWQEKSNPPYESVNEFKVATSVFTAQYGHGQGVVSYNFTSGTNALHGELHEFARNDIFDARSFFSPTKSLNRQNEYGFTVGGPIWIPKVYNGKNKTFFNFAFSRFQFRGAPLTGYQTVPTTAERQGDFSGLVDSSGNMIPIYDPVTRTPFTGNLIPSTRFSSVAKLLIPLIPDPTYPGVINNIGNGITNLPIDDNTWSLRVDHNLTERQRISYTMWRDTNSKSALCGSNLAGPLGCYMAEPELEHAAIVNYTYTIRPNLVMTAGFSWSRDGNSQYPTEKNPGLNISGVPTGFVLPAYTFSGPVDIPVQLGSGYPGSRNMKLGLGFVDNFLWVKGKHYINIGVEVRRPYQNNYGWNSASFNFTNLTTSLPGSPNFSTYGHPFASFLLGLADSATFSSPSVEEPRSWYTAAYIQDDFKVTPKLTLNLGLRHDAFVPFTERYNKIVYFDPTVANPDAGGILGALEKLGQCSSGCAGKDQIATIHWWYFAPRIGVAYRLDDKTVLRAGYGITFLNGGTAEFGTNKVVGGFANGLVAQARYVSPNSGVTPGYGSIDQTYPSLTAPGFSPSAGIGQNVNYLAPYNGQVPYLANWTMGVQREVPGSIILSASYVGNHAVRVPSGLQNLEQVNPRYLSLGGVLLDDINSPEAQAAGISAPYPGFTGSVGYALRPYPQYTGITSNFDECGAATYNGLQITAQKRFSQGLQFLVSFTASRFMSNTSSGFSTFNGAPINTFDRKAEWSIDPNSVPRVLAISGIYELPFGPGKKLVNRKGVAGKIVGGWQFGWVLMYQGGNPVGFSASNVLPLYNGGNRPNLVSSTNPCMSKSGFDPAKNVEFNLAAFSQPADYTFGNAPRVQDNCFTFPYYNEDMNLVKYIRFTEKVNLEFRAEFFDIFNRVQFSTGNTSYSPGSTNFGVVGGQANSPRTGQLGLKLNF